MSAQRIEADLRACTDSFVNLVRAARIGDESAASKKRKVNGHMESSCLSARLEKCKQQQFGYRANGRHLGRLMCSH